MEVTRSSSTGHSLLMHSCFMQILTNNHQAILASCNTDTDLVSVGDETQVGSQPSNIGLLLPPISGGDLAKLP